VKVFPVRLLFLSTSVISFDTRATRAPGLGERQPEG
jgi:hypothetical protein